MQIKGRKIKNKYIVLLSIFALFLIGRATLPSYLLKKTNEYLGSFSPTYAIHLDDMDLSFLRGAYEFEGVKGTLKDKSKKEFLSIKEVDVSIAWREILKGQIVTDIIVDDIDFVIIKDINKLSTSKESRNKTKDYLFPLKIEKVELRRSSITLDEYQAIDGNGKMRISNINGIITNLRPENERPLSRFDLTANILDSSKIKIDGSLNQLQKPLAWTVNGEMNKVDLRQFNPLLLAKLPLTFTKGTMDLYAEAQSKNGVVRGYIKPFLNDLDIVNNEGEDFKGLKHFGVEILTALGNVILRDESKNRSVATKIDFTYDKKFDVNVGEAVKKAIKHGTADKEDKEEQKDIIERGVEGRYGEVGGSDVEAE